MSEQSLGFFKFILVVCSLDNNEIKQEIKEIKTVLKYKNKLDYSLFSELPTCVIQDALSLLEEYSDELVPIKPLSD